MPTAEQAVKPRKTLKESRSMYIVKANDLIRKAQYDLSTNQQKIVLYCISKIKPNDTPDTRYTITVSELCRVCNWNIENGGTYYSRIKQTFQSLVQREWCKMPDNSEATFSWIGDVKIYDKAGLIEYTFNPNVQPYLFNVQTRYTQYKLEQILVFKNKYAIRLYEILRSYTTQKALENREERIVNIDLNQIYSMIQNDSYSDWNNFNNNILKKAVKEINNCSEDMHVDYSPVKTGRTVTSVQFVISRTKARQEIETWRRNRMILGET